MEKTKWAVDTRVSGNGHEKWPAGMYPPAIFQALLRHERSRSDRDGSEFSLVVLDVTGMHPRDIALHQIVRTIQEKIRSIDEVGWLDTHSIGILLTVTKAEGGRGFAHRLSEAIPTPLSPVPWTVFTYPQHWLPGADGERSEGAGGDHDRGGKGIERIFSQKVPFWKRCADLLGSVVLIAALSPLFLLLFVYIKAVSPGKALYRQQRVGYRGKMFTFLKFRTMSQNNNCDIHREHLRELIKSSKPMEKLDQDRDPRIIPGGKILRKACLDELPQLFNVLRGEMSLVGPRPCIPYEAEEYLRWHTRRFDILPGMTGLWQVSGKNKLSFEQMVRLDISYAKRMSLLLDLRILFLTLPAIIGMVFEAGMKRLSLKLLKPTTVSLAKDDEKGFFSDA